MNQLPPGTARTIIQECQQRRYKYLPWMVLDLDGESRLRKAGAAEVAGAWLGSECPVFAVQV
eukprot:1160705-Pelagomonas_calceolata.AAC.22